MEDKKINIGLFIDTWYPMVDGVIGVVNNYATRLSKIANVTVFAPKAHGKFDNSKLPYKVIQCKCSRLFFLDYDLPMPKFDKEFKKAIKEANLDLIHIHSPFGIGKMATKYGKKNNIPVVATFHSQFEKDFYRATKSKAITKALLDSIMKVFNKCDECWCVNDAIGKVFVKYGYKGTPITHNNGTDFELVKDEKTADEIINQKYELCDSIPVFLFVGRITILKNILLIVDSLKIVKEQGHKFKMLFVGSGKDEPILEKHIKDCGLENEIILCGKIYDREFLKSIYHRAKLFLFPSIYDASSLVQIEAASQKTPTLFIKGAVTADTIVENVNGYTAENSPQKYAEKIIEILNNKQLYDEICKNCFEQLFLSWDDAVNQAYERYLELIKERK